MAKAKFELDLNGLSKLMKSSEMESVLTAAGNAVANAAGSDYSVNVYRAPYVSMVYVDPTSYEAAKDNYENHTLLRAVGAAGLSMK